MKVSGIHHITAIASDPRQCVDFYTKILGLRLVKKTVNQDDTATYHLFFGDKEGSAGMDLTFFTFQPSYPGRRGNGLVTTISLAVPEKSLDFWQQRFQQHNVKFDEIAEVWGRKRMFFYDTDDQRLELVGVPVSELADQNWSPWTTSEISEQQAIRYFYSATLTVVSREQIDPVLQTLGYKLVDQYELSYLYQIPGQDRAGYLQVDEHPTEEAGINMAGTVHHIAFQVKDETEQMQVRQKIRELGLFPTQVIDRFYFKSVYFRTPAGILFELATLGPGFTADEKLEELGEKLALPPFLEDQRHEIEAGLEEI